MAKAQALKPHEGFANRLKATEVADLPTFFEGEFLTGRPFLFATDAQLDRFREHIAKELGIAIAATEVFLVGSAATGFSLNPDHYFAPFNSESDIDVAVVNASLFDAMWMAMVRWEYLSRAIRRGHDRNWLSDRRKDVFGGWCTPAFLEFRPQGLDLSVPEELKPVRDQRHRWFSVFRSLSRYRDPDEVARHRVKARLYRTRGHLTAYHAHGLRVLRAQL